jgi:phosphoglycerate kinase
LDADFESFDIGPDTRARFADVIKRANSIFWNGPVGVFEIPQFRNGSEAVMRSIISRTKEGATSVVGGGDSVSLINTFGEKKSFTFISTGGGASLELMQGNKMPGIDSLSNLDELK